ncbi:GNAT family N-acetyltransferase [Parasediminibacterium paludis]|uniref:GNAT family N-acetyltransferase n=1 Tax=Parasediminibacterium paludis TaxID=908966 RepID=A0ABV8PSR9_9BACT
MHIITITPNHYPQVAAIYLQGIATGQATFQTEAPTWQEWDKGHLPFCRLAAMVDHALVGWVALSPVSARPVYKGVAELSIYVAAMQRGKGIGKYLLQAAIKESEDNGIWTLQSGIFKDNTSSIQLHLRCGFREIGYREKIGCLNGVWKDNIIMERRSTIIGLST